MVSFFQFPDQFQTDFLNDSSRRKTTMAFTTWSDLKTKMENDIADRSWMCKRYEMDGDVMEYATFSDFMNAYDRVCFMAELNSGAPVGRTYAKSGGLF
jgi:hypothetical protein